MSEASESVVRKLKSSTSTVLSGGSLGFLLLMAPFAKELLETQVSEQRRMSDALMETRDSLVELRSDVRLLRDRIDEIDELERTIADVSTAQDELGRELEAVRRCIRNRKDCDR